MADSLTTRPSPLVRVRVAAVLVFGALRLSAQALREVAEPPQAAAPPDIGVNVVSHT